MSVGDPGLPTSQPGQRGSARSGASGWDGAIGIDPGELPAEDLLRELASLHDTRHATFRHGSEDALVAHNRRTAELEAEYLRRYPQREVDPTRQREGARRAAAER
jgi:hypothetical protein